MKNTVLFVLLFLGSLASANAATISNLTYEDRHTIYYTTDFGGNPVDQHVFDFAFKGYLKLRDQNKLKKDHILTIIDYSKSSSQKRLWVIDLFQRKVLFNDWTSHGKYTGSEYASSFSNVVNSKKTSIGFFVTGGTYNGKHKYSLKLHGMERGYNSNAFRRGIVIHGADYVQPNDVGRSYGCPAIRQEIKYALIDTIKDGSCVFSYYPAQAYMDKSGLLN
ncbi:MAG: murein L,D-transpeptidase catalytic domain family protein [Saprospiraceae bacterium]|nr:murein L,D-transpeptidase catalytic domain family protein [Saprospiraceae bacterium]